MNPEAFTSLLDALAEALAPRIAAKMGETVNNPNELMSVPKMAKELRVAPRVVRRLIEVGTLKRVPDIREPRVSRRELERYTGGKTSK